MKIKQIKFMALRKLHLSDHADFSRVPAINCGDFNIIIGPNGGGKSTIIDLIRSFGEPGLISTMPRENMKNSTISGFSVIFSGGETISALFNCVDIDIFGTTIYSVNASHIKKYYEGSLKKFSKETTDEINEVVRNVGAKVYYRNSYDNVGIPAHHFFEVLNESAIHLNGLAPFPLDNKQFKYAIPTERLEYYLKNPVMEVDGETAHVAFNDDESQTNHIPISAFPSGWKAFGGLIAWIKNLENNCICVIEEPEVHLHPQLQRILIKKIYDISKQKNIQVFITTHSSIFISDSYSIVQGSRLFEVDGYSVRELTSPASLLSKLGVRPSDVLQTNGVIWVEGPSDRIYILHWLTLYCQSIGVQVPTENYDFSFMLYGGAIIKHYTTENISDSGVIDILKINQNCILVMDRDSGDFSEKNHAILSGLDKIKFRLSDDINADPRKMSWITQGYTIESYLPDDFFNRFFSCKNGKVLSVSSVGKVKISEIFSNECNQFYESFKKGSDLMCKIEKIYHLINQWKI